MQQSRARRIGALAIMAVAGAASARAEELVVHSPAGSFQASMEACFADPFTKETGAKIGWVQGGSVNAAARLRATAGSPDIDVAYMDIHIADQPKREGLLERIKFDELKSYPDVVPSAFDPDGYLVTILGTGTIIAYNPKEVSPPPTSWNDFFDKRVKGRIGLGDLQNTSGYHFLIAMARLRGGSLENIEPGFDAVKQLMPSVAATYSQADQLVSLFERGDVVIAPWYPDRAGRAADGGAPVAVAYPKEGAIGILGTLSVPKGTKRIELAKKFIDVALSEPAQKCFAERQYSGPVNKRVRLSDKALSLVPFGATFDQLYFPDFRYVAQKQPEWVERWRREIQR